MQNKRAVIVGIFILLGLVILVVTIFTLGGQKKTFVKTVAIKAVFNDVNGLMQGGNVWYSGVKVGTIKKISFAGDSRVEVTMNIEKSVVSHIHKNAMAKISSDGLIGNKIVVIYGGDNSSPVVEKDNVLAAENASANSDMMATLQQNNKNLLAITTDFKSVSRKIDSGTGLIATLINDPAMAARLRSSMSDLQTAVANFKTVSVTGNTVFNNLQTFSGKLNQPGSSINKFVSDTMMYSSVMGDLQQLRNATKSVSAFAANLEKTSAKLGQDNSVAGVLLNDPASAIAMKKSIITLQSASKKLDDDLEAVQHNFLLRHFFKKKAKAEAKAKADSVSITD